jgi:hypothetical protein
MLQHGGARLLWYYDIHLLVTRESHRLEWDAIERSARTLGWTDPLQAALHGVRERFHTVMPSAVLTESAPVVQPLGGAKPYDEAAWDEVAGLSWKARLRFVWDHAFPGKDYIHWRYQPKPKWLWPLYYPYRWLTFVIGGLKLAIRKW